MKPHIYLESGYWLMETCEGRVACHVGAISDALAHFARKMKEWGCR